MGEYVGAGLRGERGANGAQGVRARRAGQLVGAGCARRRLRERAAEEGSSDDGARHVCVRKCQHSLADSATFYGGGDFWADTFFSTCARAERARIEAWQRPTAPDTESRGSGTILQLQLSKKKIGQTCIAHHAQDATGLH